MIIEGMANEKQRPSQSKEKWLIEKLKENPELMERFETIIKITESTDDPKQTADEVEELLLEAVRKLGKTSMESWAEKVEEKTAEEFKRQNEKVHYGKKKS